jgi:membrane-associated phospholipid phosphatase
VAGVAAMVGGGLAARRPAEPAPDHGQEAAAVGEWMELLYDLVMAQGASPPAAARAYAYAYASVALYEAVTGGSGRYRSLAGQLNGLTRLPTPDPHLPVDRPSAATAAVATVAEALFPPDRLLRSAEIAPLRKDLLARRRAAGVPAAVAARSTAHGHRIGQRVVAWSESDGYAATVGRAYRPPTGPGRWAPEAGLVAVEPHWGTLRPLSLPAPDAYRPPAPPALYSTDPSSAFYAQDDRIYQAGLALTDEQREIAVFWTDNARLSGTPAGHWMLIAKDMTNRFGMSLAGAAEVYAVLAIALADAFLSCWQEKYRTNLLRPDAYIGAHIDPRWSTFVATPVFPEYTSGHSVASRAAAAVLAELLGEVSFTDNTHATRTRLKARAFTSFHHAAEEAAMSRLYGGIHYPMSIEVGLSQGEDVGRHVIATLQTRR